MAKAADRSRQKQQVLGPIPPLGCAVGVGLTMIFIAKLASIVGGDYQNGFPKLIHTL